MKKLLMLLVAVGMIAAFSYAHEGMEMGSKGKEITITGILVDANCYLKDGHQGDDHDSMKKCGRDCLKGGLPAGVLVGKKLYVMVFPGSVFADCVGKKVEISGDLYGEDVLIPEKASVVEKGTKKPLKLRGKVMM